ncbi:MAG TPA: tRNA pseudouridine(55) synthase TruB [Bryobacteraceae bacterium]|jgi:tRNA pseudouridine55 synthase
MDGLVLIDKPAGCTSHDVVNRWRKLAKTKRAGHLGTLDPMATGLLALVTGTATRLARFYGKQDKTYRAEITLGVFSDTYDAEGRITETGVAPPSDDAIVHAALARFSGRFLQTPPPVSAKKIGGVRAYKLARQQAPVELQPVEVEVKRLDVESIAGPKVEIVVTCSAGAYIRSIAHDLGGELGCGALLSRLRRTQAGEFTIEDAKTIAELTELAAQERLAEVVIPPAKLLAGTPSQHFDALAEVQIRQGRDFRTSPFVVPPGAPFVKALSQTGELIAIGELKIPNLYHPGTVLS